MSLASARTRRRIASFKGAVLLCTLPAREEWWNLGMQHTRLDAETRPLGPQSLGHVPEWVIAIPMATSFTKEIPQG